MSRPILVLGGTAEGREVADALFHSGVPVISSLAGRVARPRLPLGDVRVGGFGGPDALARWLVEQDVAGVVDATHPFARRISASAAVATAAAAIPLLRLERAGWREADGDRWVWVDDVASAAAKVIELAGARVFLTTGRQGLAAFAPNDAAWFLIRCVEAPGDPLPPRHAVVLDRGPFAYERELALIDTHAIDLLVTKDSGGPLTAAKLAAARTRGLPVVVVRRPPRLDAVATVVDVAAAAAWARLRAGAGGGGQ
jgi:precorrin-6A/cobalt-precorrin-6A reductase